MKQPSRQNHRNNRNNKGGRRSSGGGSGGGHSANRVYDSAGPEGKVRGTAQQIIDKYTSLARDAQTSGEGVLAENFFQHAEHYQRILMTIQAAEAEERERRQAAHQAEQERRAEQQARQQQQRAEQQVHEAAQPATASAASNDEQSQPANRINAQDRLPPSSADENNEAENAGTESTTEVAKDGPALVETPESKRAEQRDVTPRPARRTRARPAATKPAEAAAGPQDASIPADTPSIDNGTAETSNQPATETVPETVAEAPVKPKRGRPRKTPPPPPSEEADVTS